MRDTLYWRLRFIAVMVSFAVAALVLFRESIVGPAFVPLREATAQVTLTLLHLIGFECVRFGTILYHPGGFGYEISRGCTGFVPAALIATAVLAYPASIRNRTWGILVGVPTFLLLNFIRLVHLFVIGVWWPARFDVAHEVVWQGVMMLSTFIIWFGWTIWSDRRRGSTSPPLFFSGLVGTWRGPIGIER
jgi:exosortase/archaeosortase family protein